MPFARVVLCAAKCRALSNKSQFYNPTEKNVYLKVTLEFLCLEKPPPFLNRKNGKIVKCHFMS